MLDPGLPDVGAFSLRQQQFGKKKTCCSSASVNLSAADRAAAMKKQEIDMAKTAMFRGWQLTTAKMQRRKRRSPFGGGKKQRTYDLQFRNLYSERSVNKLRCKIVPNSSTALSQ
jgi:hypothetical protein